MESGDEKDARHSDEEEETYEDDTEVMDPEPAPEEDHEEHHEDDAHSDVNDDHHHPDDEHPDQIIASLREQLAHEEDLRRKAVAQAQDLMQQLEKTQSALEKAQNDLQFDQIHPDSMQDLSKAASGDTAALQKQLHDLQQRIQVEQKLNSTLKAVADGKLAAVEQQTQQEMSKETERRLQAEENTAAAEQRLKKAQRKITQLEQEIARVNGLKEQALQRENKMKATVETLHNTISQLEEERAHKMAEYDRAKEEMERVTAGTREQRTAEALRSLPEYGDMDERLGSLEAALRAEKEGREAALDAWEKAEKKVKFAETRYEETRAEYEKEIKSLVEEKDAIVRENAWHQEQTKRSSAEQQALRDVIKEKEEEITTLRVRLGGIHSEIRAANELEKLRAQMMVENMRTEMEWREKMLKRQGEINSAKVEAEQLERLKAERALRQAQLDLAQAEKEASLKNNDYAYQETRQKKRETIQQARSAAEQQTLSELADLDSRIKKLRRNVDEKQSLLRTQEVDFLPPLGTNTRVTAALEMAETGLGLGPDLAQATAAAKQRMRAGGGSNGSLPRLPNSRESQSTKNRDRDRSSRAPKQTAGEEEMWHDINPMNGDANPQDSPVAQRRRERSRDPSRSPNPSRRRPPPSEHEDSDEEHGEPQHPAARGHASRGRGGRSPRGGGRSRMPRPRPVAADARDPALGSHERRTRRAPRGHEEEEDHAPKRRPGLPAEAHGAPRRRNGAHHQEAKSGRGRAGAAPKRAAQKGRWN